MHENLVKFSNLLIELSAEALLSEARFSSMVTLVVENFFPHKKRRPSAYSYGVRNRNRNLVGISILTKMITIEEIKKLLAVEIKPINPI